MTAVMESWETTFALGRGDRVALVGETDLGLIRAQAVVLGETSPDWYLGRLEDGSEVEFRVDQVEDAVRGNYSMGGFMDWFKKKPAPETRSLIQSPTEGKVIYVGPTGVAKFEPPKKKKGLLAPIKEAVKTFFTDPGEGGSIFDIFKTTTALIPEPEKEAIKFEKVASLFSQFVPEPKSLEPVIEKMTSLMPPEGPTLLAPYIEKAQEIFQYVQPSAPLVPHEERKARAMELWKEMFEPSKEEEALEKAEIFQPSPEAPPVWEAFPESEIVPDAKLEIPEAYYEDRPGEKMEIKALPMPPRNTLFPAVEDVARGLIGLYVRKGETFPNKFFKEIKQISDDWREGGAPGVVLKEIVETIGLHDGTPDPFEGMAIFLQIPWEEFRKRAEIEDLGDEGEEWVEVSEITEQIMYPAMELVNNAFELITPEDVPGHFSVEYSEDCGCLQIYYVDQTRELSPAEEESLATYGYLEVPEEEETEEEEEAPKRAPKKKKKKSSKRKAKR